MPKAKPLPKSPKARQGLRAVKSQKGKKPNEPKPLTKVEQLELIGFDQVCAWIQSGESQSSICKRLDVSVPELCRWLASTPERSARAREARQQSAEAWMDKGAQELIDAKDSVGVAKARELAQHYRRMAAIRNPRYSDRLQVDAEVGMRALSDDELNERLQRLLGQ